MKPANIMVGAFGEVQVMDWGLAKVIAKLAEEEDAPSGSSTVRSLQTRGDLALSQTGDVMGTPAYMAPEQARGEIRSLDTRADVFGLGAILCQILTGKPAFQGESSLEIILQAADGKLDDAFQRLDACGADAKLIDLCKKCVAPNKKDRLHHGGSVAEAVAAYESQVQERLRQAELAKAQAEVQAVEERKRREVEEQRAEAQQQRADEETKRREAEQAKTREERRRRWTQLAAVAVVVLLVAAGTVIGFAIKAQNDAALQAQETKLQAEGEAESLVKQILAANIADVPP